MTEKPLVSVIINCYNGEKYLREAIDSVLKQTYEHFEIVFWDNLSTDRTAEIIKSYNEPRIRYFLAEEKTPLGEARNLAINKCSGTFICFLDSDDIWESHFLESCVCALLEDDCIGLVYTRYIHFSDSTSWLSRGIGKSGIIETENLIKRYNIGMSAAMFKKSNLEKTNIMFDTRFSLIEDFDFFLKLACISKVYYISQPLMRYRHHDNQSSFSSKWVEEYEMMIINIESGEYPPLMPYCNSVRNLQGHYKILMLIKKRKRLLALKNMLIQLRKDKRVLRYIFPIIFGDKINFVLIKILKLLRRV